MIYNGYFLSSRSDLTVNWLPGFVRNGIDWRASYEFWGWSNDALGQLHMYTAIAALLIGAVTLARRKGDIAHRLLGLVYVFAMFATNITALTMYEFSGGPNFFHAAAVMSLLTSAAALLAIVVYASTRAQKALEAHLELMSWSYFGVVLAAVAEIVMRGLRPQIDGQQAFWTVFSISMAITGLVGAVLVNIYVRNVKRRWFGDRGETTHA